VAHFCFFSASTTAIVGAPSMTQPHRGMGGTAPRPTSSAAAATAKRFHEEGATVIVRGSNPTTVEAGRKAMPCVDAVVSDAGDPGAAMARVDRIKGIHWRIDMLFATNARGPYFLLKHAIPVLSDGASIILTSSASAVQGVPGLSAYSASKAALRSLGMSLAAELAPAPYPGQYDYARSR
jgi:NAD(P)-dependent dehydrogenase (short-subunit alcohol dehydrogenase family)